MTAEQLARLYELVHVAEAHVHRPWKLGETSRPIEFFTDHLGDEGWRLGWVLVGALREAAPDLFGSYGEAGLHRGALDVILSFPEPPAALEQIADALRDEASGDDGARIVVIPLANVALSRPWAPLGDCAAIQRASESDAVDDADVRETLELEEFQADRDVRKHLGDRLPPAPRRLQIGGQLLDTGRSASLISVEHGPPPIAIEAARAKALYALATWAVLAPPVDWHLMPDIAVWTPQPSLSQRTQHKLFEPGTLIAHERTSGGDYRRWAPYELPADDLLPAPFEAFERLDRRPAQALLSSTAAVHAGSRATRSQLSERLRDVRAAIESLCQPPPGVRGNADSRWKHLAERFGVWEELADARAYTPQQIKALQERLDAARNISAHRAEAALIDLGWTRGSAAMRGRGKTKAEDLAVTALQRDIGPMLHALGQALRGTWAAMREADFGETAFEALFK